MKTWRIVQHIFEGESREPVLTHVFYGTTEHDAEAVFRAHLQADAFMRGCVTHGGFRDFRCRASMHTETYDGSSWRAVGSVQPCC